MCSQLYPEEGISRILQNVFDFDQYEREVKDLLIRTLQKTLGLTVYMVTHDLDSLYSIYDRIAALAGGKIVAAGTLQEILQVSHPWVQSYFHGARARARGGSS